MGIRAKHMNMKHFAFKQRGAWQVGDWADQQPPSGTQLMLSIGLWVAIVCVTYNLERLPMLWTIIVSVLHTRDQLPMLFPGVPVLEPFNKYSQDAIATPCWAGPLPSSVRQFTDGKEPHATNRALATVTLYGPCPLSSYVKVAHRHVDSAHAWIFVQTNTTNKIVVRHHGEPPSTVRGGYRTETMLAKRIANVFMPRVALFLHPEAYFYNSILKLGLVTFLPEPALTGLGFDHKYLAMLFKLQDRFRDSYDFTYLLPDMYAGRVASEFGVTSFPSLVVHKEFPGRSAVYHGDMTFDSVELFLSDVSLGCADYGSKYMAGWSKKRDHLVCDATPILEST